MTRFGGSVVFPLHFLLACLVFVLELLQNNPTSTPGKSVGSEVEKQHILEISKHIRRFSFARLLYRSAGELGCVRMRVPFP